MNPVYRSYGAKGLARNAALDVIPILKSILPVAGPLIIQLE